MSEVMDQFTGKVGADLKKKAEETNLIPTGRYKGELEKVEVKAGDVEFFKDDPDQPNPFYQKQVGNLQYRLTSKREGKGRTAPWQTMETPRVLFIRACPDTVMSTFDNKKLSKESRHFGLLAAVADKVTGQVNDAPGVINWLKENPVEINVNQYPSGSTDDGSRSWDAGNYIREISAVKD